MHNLFKTAATLCIMLALTACGFKPVYSEHNAALPVKIGAISIRAQEPGKLDYTFKHALSQAMRSNDASAQDYTLNVELIKSTLSFDTQNNRVTSRNRLDLRANFTLLDRNKKVIFNDFAIASDSYEVTSSPYSSLISEEETTNLLAKALAQEIVMHLLDVIHDR